MRSNKPFTNATFTKRVDHEAGRHRPPRAIKEPAVCGACGAVYVNRRWSEAGSLGSNKKHKNWRPAQTTVCPACKQKRAGEPRGFVFLDGAFFVEHQKESNSSCGMKLNARLKTIRWRVFSNGKKAKNTSSQSARRQSTWPSD